MKLWQKQKKRKRCDASEWASIRHQLNQISVLFVFFHLLNVRECEKNRKLFLSRNSLECHVTVKTWHVLTFVWIFFETWPFYAFLLKTFRLHFLRLDVLSASWFIPFYFCLIFCHQQCSKYSVRILTIESFFCSSEKGEKIPSKEFAFVKKREKVK